MRSPSYIYNKIKRITLVAIYSFVNNRKGVLRIIDVMVRQQSRYFDKFYSAKNPMLSLSGKRVIVIADRRPTGLADRLRGVIYVYNRVAELIREGENIDFSISFESPFLLANYLEPNGYQWQISPDEISYNPEQVEWINLGMAKFKKYGFSIELSAEYLQQRIKDSKANQIHIFTNMNVCKKDSFAESFKELFRPAKRVQEMLSAHYQTLSVGGGYLSATFRFQNLLGDFYEGEIKPLETESKMSELIAKCTVQVVRLHKKYPNKKILVTSDSRTFLDAMSSLPYAYTISGKLVHLGHTTDTSFDTYVKSFVDWLMIANAEKIYLLRTGKMYKSGFPQTASLIRNRPFKYIEF